MLSSSTKNLIIKDKTKQKREERLINSIGCSILLIDRVNRKNNLIFKDSFHHIIIIIDHFCCFVLFFFFFPFFSISSFLIDINSYSCCYCFFLSTVFIFSFVDVFLCDGILIYDRVGSGRDQLSRVSNI
jgi:hypothetical protein